MNGYKSKALKVQQKVDSQYPASQYSEAERKRVFKQFLAKEIVGWNTTIGSVIDDQTGKRKFVLDKANPLSKPNLP